LHVRAPANLTNAVRLPVREAKSGLVMVGFEEPPLILCFRTTRPGPPRQRGCCRKRCGSLNGAYGCDVRPQRSTLMVMLLRLELFLCIAEVGVVSVLIAKRVSLRLTLAVFLSTLLLPCLMTAAVLRDIQRAHSIDRVRRLKEATFTKLCLLAGTASLPASLALFAFGMGIAEASQVTISLLGYHAVFSVLTVRLVVEIIGLPLHRLLKFDECRSCRFADMPQTGQMSDVACAICLCEMEGDDPVFVLPCRHVFHTECLGEWLLRSDTCPLRCADHVLMLPELRTDVASGGRHTPGIPTMWESPGTNEVVTRHSEPHWRELGYITV